MCCVASGRSELREGWGASLGNRGMSCAPARPTGKITPEPRPAGTLHPLLVIAGHRSSSRLAAAAPPLHGEQLLGACRHLAPPPPQFFPFPPHSTSTRSSLKYGGPKWSRPTTACAPPQGDKHPSASVLISILPTLSRKTTDCSFIANELS